VFSSWLIVDWLLDAFGFSDQSTISQLLNTFGGLGDTTLGGLVTDLGIGNNSVFELTSNLLDGITVDQYLTNVLDALAAA
jgi:hypothetical protein